MRLFLYAAVFPFILQDGRHALHGAYCTMQFFVAKLCTPAGVTALHERIKEGFLKRTPRGREATPLAYQHLGFTHPRDGEASLF